MSGLRLHWSPDSANLVIRMALEELGLAYEADRIDRARGQHRGADYLHLNPQGLLPVLEDGGTPIFETGAILVHLIRRTGRLGPDVPDAGEAGTRALVWLFYLSNTLHADLRAAFYSPRYIAEPLIPELRRGLAARVRDHFALLDAEIAGAGGAWLLGPGPTLPDIYLGCLARWARLYPGAAPLLDRLDCPSLTPMLAKLEARPAIRAACAAEAIASPRPLTEPEPPDLPRAEITG